MTSKTGKAAPEDASEPTRRGWLSFWSLLVLQTQNAFNDKAAQFLLIPIGVWLLQSGTEMTGVNQIEYILAAIIVIPFILFSPLSGWFSDRYSKAYIVRATSILQLVVLTGITVCIYYQQLWFAVLGFFILAMQSVLLGPAKRGLVKEIVGPRKLGMASGLLEISAVLAICAGQIITGIIFSARRDQGLGGWDAAFTPMVVLTIGSILAVGASLIIQKTPVLGKREFRASIFTEHIGQLKNLLSERSLRLSASGVAFFWGFAGFINLAAIGIAKQLIGNGSDDNFAFDSAMFMTAASLGIIIGGAFASFICRKGIELGLIPLGGLVMVIGNLALAVTPIESEWLKIWFAVAGAGGALLLVPLNANIQDLAPPEKRGQILAGLGLLDCLVGLAAVIIQMGLVKIGVPFSWQFIGLAIVCIFATRYSAKLLPQHVVRLVVLGIFKMFYRVRAMNAERIPAEGGVLMTPNHVSYMDAFILSTASPRKVRFLMFDAYFKRPWIGRFVKLFDTVPISQTRAKEAMRVAAEALEQGYLVCIFPEGQLTRSGGMNEFKRGFEMIAKKAKCPVLPAAMDGLWGSIFSFERGKFIYKFPYCLRYGVTVNFGEIIPPEEIKAGKVRFAVSELRADAFAQRRILENPMSILSKEPMILAPETSLMKSYQQRVLELRDEEPEAQKRLVANALQVGDVNVMHRGQKVIMEWTGLESCRDVIAIAFAQYFQLKLILVDSSISSAEILQLTQQHEVDQYMGGRALADACAKAGLQRVCYDFSEQAVSHNDALPCLVMKQRVISMSMPHPEAETITNQHQDGYREGTWGRLLPGYQVSSGENNIIVSGVSLEGNEGLKIEDAQVDLEGFIEQSS